MTCPHCNKQLTISREKASIIYNCPYCDGKLISFAILRKETINHDYINKIWNTAFQSPESIRHCPKCGSAMAYITVPDKQNRDLHLDICKKCIMVWFDPAEYDNIPFIREKTDLEKEDPYIKKMTQEMVIQKIKDNVQANQHSIHQEIKNKAQYVPLLLGLPIDLESSKTEKKPWISPGVSCLLILFFTLSQIDFNHIIESFGFIPYHFKRYGFITFISSFLLHGNIIHVLGNIYFLIVFGSKIEESIGKTRFIIILFFSHIIGILTYFLFNTYSDTPVIGASAGISGIMGVYMVKYPIRKIALFIRFHFIKAPVFVFFIFWVLLQILYIIGFQNNIPIIAPQAHLGGFICGIVFGIYLRITRTKD